MKLCICGLGYIGLPTAAVFASNGVFVNGVEVNQHTIDIINQGKIHIIEPGLGEIVKSVVESGHLKVSDKACEADGYIICVPTPFIGDHEPDLSYVDAAAINAKISSKKRALALDLLNIITGTDALARAQTNGGSPQYLLSARYSIYDAMASDYPLYEELKKIASVPDAFVFRIKPDGNDYLEEAEKNKDAMLPLMK